MGMERRAESIGVSSMTGKGGMNLGAENKKRESCLQRDSAEREEVCRSGTIIPADMERTRQCRAGAFGEDTGQRQSEQSLQERVKANKGAPGVDGMTIEEAFPYLREHKDELIGRILRGEIYPVSSPTRRDPEAGRRSEETGHTDRHRPNHPASHDAAADAHL